LQDSGNIQEFHDTFWRLSANIYLECCGTLEAALLDEPDQLAVIGGLQNGCRDAWARLYDGYSVDLWRYVARLLGGDAASVADVVQETFIEAAQSARKFDSARGTIWSWLTGIAHHRASAHWRRVQSIKALHDRVKSDLMRRIDAMGDSRASSDALEQSELAESVRATLAELPSDYSALLLAKYLDNRELADLSREWSSSNEAMKSKLARARREFRARFSQPDDSAGSITSEKRK
jgi:RNA polymerase sigma-70 factor (ECF subfamily)